MLMHLSTSGEYHTYEPDPARLIDEDEVPDDLEELQGGKDGSAHYQHPR